MNRQPWSKKDDLTNLREQLNSLPIEPLSGYGVKLILTTIVDHLAGIDKRIAKLESPIPPAKQT
jgi:hypothetical protein